MGKKKPAPKPASDKPAAIPAKYLKPCRVTPLPAATAAASGVVGLGMSDLAVTATNAMMNVMRRLGYTTVEEVLAVLQAAKRELVRRHGLPAAALDALERFLAPHATAIPAPVGLAVSKLTLSFGVISDGTAPPPSDRGTDSVALLNAVAAPAAPVGLGIVAAVSGVVGFALPPEVNMIDELANPVRNQGPRNTCVPHSCLVAYEHYRLKKEGDTVDLSEQFLFFACKQRDGIPTNAAGTFAPVAADVLGQIGVCEESVWPYNSSNSMDLAGNPGQGPPPAGAQAAAGPFRAVEVIRVRPNVVNDFKQVLATGRCVTFSIFAFPSSFNINFPGVQAVFARGRVILPVVGEARMGGHAMCMVGYRDNSAEPGGGSFIIRNSFGPAWGANSEFGPGLGTIPYEYITRHAVMTDIGIAFM